MQTGRTLKNFLEEEEKKYGLKFFFLSEWLDGITLNKDYTGYSLRSLLDEVLEGRDINYLEFPYSVVFVKDPGLAIKKRALMTSVIQQGQTIEHRQLGIPDISAKKKKITIRGTIKSNKNDYIPGVNVQVNETGTGAVSNEQGQFLIGLQSGEYLISISHVGFEEKIISLSAYSDGEMNISLSDVPVLLEEVVVHDKSREAVTSSVGQVSLSIKEIKRAPGLLGEADLIKQIQLLPGVTTVGEAASGYNVRGGSVDQNLILFDGMPVFNSSHVFGFFSAFNAEAIRDVTFYRGGIPAEFGGRVSSVLNINSKEGNFEKWGGGGGIGILTSNFNVGGPIAKNKTSFAASARTTYSDWLVNSIRTNYADLSKSTLTFYDAHAKIAHKFSTNTKLTISGYSSRDQFRLKGDSTYSWNNLLGTAKLDHVFSPKINASVLIGYGSYEYRLADKNRVTGFDLNYKITYPSFESDIAFHSGKHSALFGVHATYYSFNPGTFSPHNPNSGLNFVQMEKQQSIESAVYLRDNFSLSDNFNVEGGLRLSMFRALGPGTVTLYKSGQPIEITNAQGTRSYKAGEDIKTYYGLEPRFSLRYSITPYSSIKLGYNRVYQYLHLVTNSAAVTPVDIWQPSGYYFKPQKADQTSLGYFCNFKKKTYEAFIEGYYKEIENIIDFKDGAKLILNPNIETDLLQGKGTAYGIETQVSKILGRLTGSLSYAFSRSFRTIKGSTSAESVNNGKTYASNFDQPHAINLTWKYAISKRIFFTGGFTYRTGRPITMPASAYLMEGNYYVTNFSERNLYRIRDYHRLDLAIVLEGSHRRKKIADGTWTLSVYNVYSRKNPYTVFFKGTQGSAMIPYELSILGTALPSLTYSVKF